MLPNAKDPLPTKGLTLCDTVSCVSMLQLLSVFQYFHTVSLHLAGILVPFFLLAHASVKTCETFFKI